MPVFFLYHSSSSFFPSPQKFSQRKYDVGLSVPYPRASLSVSNLVYLHFKGEVGREEKTWEFHCKLRSVNIVHAQNPTFHTAKIGDAAGKKTQGLWTVSFYTVSRHRLAQFPFENKKENHQPMLSNLHPHFVSHRFSSCFSSLISSYLREDWSKNSYSCCSFTTLLWIFLPQHIKLFLLKILNIPALLCIH